MSRSGRDVRVTRLLLALATLAGVIALHGFDSHGAGANDAPAAIHATHHGPATSAEASAGHGPTREGPNHGGDDGGLAGMCFAVASGALFLGAMLLALRPAYAGPLVRHRALRRRLPRPRGRPAWPPDRFTLSIQRC